MYNERRCHGIDHLVSPFMIQVRFLLEKSANDVDRLDYSQFSISHPIKFNRRAVGIRLAYIAGLFLRFSVIIGLPTMRKEQGKCEKIKR